MLDIIYKLSLVFYYASFIAGLIYFDRLDLTARILVIFLGLELCTEILSSVLSGKGKSNLWVYNYFILFEALIFTYILMKVILIKFFRYVGLILLFIYLVTWISFTFLQPDSRLLHPVVMVVQAIIMILLNGFVLLYINTQQQSVLHDSRFWFSSALLIYFTITLFVSAISSVITTPGNELENLWIINSVANIFSHVLFIFYFVWNSRRKTLFY